MPPLIISQSGPPSLPLVRFMNKREKITRQGQRSKHLVSEGLFLTKGSMNQTKGITNLIFQTGKEEWSEKQVVGDQPGAQS